MVLKDNGNVKVKKRKHKRVKCSECKTWLDLDEMKELGDYDLLPDGSYVFYCTSCENTEIVKL